MLASASPRRLELLRQCGFLPDVIISPNIDEAQLKGEAGPALAARLASQKADLISAQYPEDFVLGADTVVFCGQRNLPKAETVDVAERCLTLLAGRTHQVATGVAVVAPGGRYALRTVVSRVRMKRLSHDEMVGYLESGEWRGKAGGYAIQGRAGAFIPSLSGSYSGVVGLPLAETVQLLDGLGYRDTKRWKARDD